MKIKFSGESFKFNTGDVSFNTIPLTNTNIKEIINQPVNNLNLKNELSKNLDSLVKNCTFLYDAKSDKDKFVHFWYFKIRNYDLMINIGLRQTGDYVLHTITNIKKPV